MSIKKIESLFNSVQLNDYDAFIDQITKLSNVIADYEGDTESIWSIGESGEYTLDSLLVGSYWHFTEWHAGQSSNSYAAMCAIGRVFNPGCTDGPEPDSSEHYVYTELDQLCRTANNLMGPLISLEN